MFNVYAQRATDPNDMDSVLNPVLHRENMIAFSWLLDRYESAPDLWAAWGTIIEKRAYLPRCVLDISKIGKEHGCRWFTAGARSLAGHPHHPLYLKKDSGLDPFEDLETYLLNLQEKLGGTHDEHL